jgi:DNA-damage-inducible protein D
MAAKKSIELIPEGELQVCQFAGREIRKVLHNDEWFFSIVDVIEALSESQRPSAYWNDLKTKLSEDEGFKGLYDKIVKLPMLGKDGIARPSDVANTETIFRIMQSIPSPKAEPFKQWLAKVGYERIQENQNPAIAIKRAIVDYQMQGRSLEWIDARLKTIVSRKELTDHWMGTGVTNTLEFAILTDEISKGTFSKTTQEHKKYKGLKKNHNLRDNMTQIELILTMLGETSTKQIAQARKALGFPQNFAAAKAGGQIAGTARKQLEEQTGESVISQGNNLHRATPSRKLMQLPPSFDESLKRFSASARVEDPE